MRAFTCNFDGPLVWSAETENDYASVGMICQWGALTVAIISDEVPDGEADEYAALFAAAPDLAKHGSALIASVMERYSLESPDDLTCPHMRGLAEALTKAELDTKKVTP